MRPNNQNRRGRGRGPRKPHGGPHSHGGGGQSKAHAFDSTGPDIRVRGNAYQVLEKYLQLARDAGTAGDRVAAENFLQHADHYYRVVAAMNEGQRPRIGGREISVADVNVQNVSQGLSAVLSGHGHSGGDEPHPAESQQGGHGNGQMRPGQDSGAPQDQQHPAQQSQSASAGSQNANGGDAGSDDRGGDGEGHAAPDEQPDYPEDLLSADAANAGARDGQPQEGRHHGRGRGRRRGPGRRIRNEGEEGGAPAPQPAPGEQQ
jgi:hypothetical protein